MLFQDAKLVLAAVALLALASGGFYLSHLQDKAGRFDAEHRARVQTENDFSAYIEVSNRRDAEIAAASQGYQNEISSLRAAIDSRPVPVVRLCPRPGHTSLPQAADSAAGPRNTPAAPGLLPGATGQDNQGRDVGADLARLMNKADILSAQSRALLTLLGAQ